MGKVEQCKNFAWMCGAEIGRAQWQCISVEILMAFTQIIGKTAVDDINEQTCCDAKPVSGSLAGESAFLCSGHCPQVLIDLAQVM